MDDNHSTSNTPPSTNTPERTPEPPAPRSQPPPVAPRPGTSPKPTPAPRPPKRSDVQVTPQSSGPPQPPAPYRPPQPPAPYSPPQPPAPYNPYPAPNQPAPPPRSVYALIVCVRMCGVEEPIIILRTLSLQRKSPSQCLCWSELASDTSANSGMFPPARSLFISTFNCFFSSQRLFVLFLQPRPNRSASPDQSEMFEFPWYHGAIPRDEAIRRLESMGGFDG